MANSPEATAAVRSLDRLARDVERLTKAITDAVSYGTTVPGPASAANLMHDVLATHAALAAHRAVYE